MFELIRRRKPVLGFRTHPNSSVEEHSGLSLFGKTARGMCLSQFLSVEDDNFLREGWGCCESNVVVFGEFLRFGLTEKALFQEIWGFAISVCRLRESGHMS